MQPRIGHGYDIHRLEPLPPVGNGRPLVLGGLPFTFDRGTIAHSDGDAVLHAVTDALLGALGEPDLGTLFPDNDPRHKGRASGDFLEEAMHRVRARGFAVGNLDVTVICQRPAIAPHRDALRASIARLIGCSPADVNIKGKTHEQVDAVGEGRALEVHAVVMLVGGG